MSQNIYLRYQNKSQTIAPAHAHFCETHRPEYTDRAIEVGGTREGQSFVLKV
jgi:hypothetical protein